MAFKKQEQKEDPQKSIAKHMQAIKDELAKFDDLNFYTLDFRRWVKREVDRIKWKHSDWLK